MSSGHWVQTETPSDPIVATLRHPLKPFQIEGVKKALACGGRFYNMDAVGLGKSPSALGFAESIRLRDGRCKTLIVTRSSLKSHWARTLAKFVGTVPCIWTDQGPQGLLAARYHVMSYSLVAKYFPELKPLGFDLTVYDEAHHVRNPSTQIGRAAYALRSKFMFAASASPALNGPGDVWPMLHHLRPDLFPSKRAFAREFGVWTGDMPRNLEWLYHLIQEIACAREAKDVAQELPELTEPEELWVDLSSMGRAAYKAAAEATVGKWERGVKPSATDVIPLQRSMETDKLERAWDLIDGLISRGHRVLLFSKFKGPVAKTARRYGDKCFVVTGDEDPSAREAAKERMQRGECALGALTFGAGSEGLDISQADVVIHLDQDWVEDTHTQASGRPRRYGSPHRRVKQYFIMGAGTVDDHLREVRANKRLWTGTIRRGRVAPGAISYVADKLSHELAK